jgi:uncharacterized protein
MMNQQLSDYLETKIIPQYNQLDTSHSPDHVYQVIENSLEIAATLTVNKEMVFTVAAFHDLGLLKGRKNHETYSRQMVEADNFLPNFFTSEQIKQIGEAVEDHRASLTYEPRSIYGKIISEADRDLNFKRILVRTIYFAMEKKALANPQQLCQEAFDYIQGKYGPKHKLTFWLDYQKNVQGLAEIHEMLADRAKFNEAFTTCYRHLTKEVGA